MKLVLVLAALIVASLAAPLDHYREAKILKYESDNIGLGSYRFAYETSDGTYREETAELKNPGTEQEEMVVRGLVKWIGADGQEYSMTYVADGTGFHPEGAHLVK